MNDDGGGGGSVGSDGLVVRVRASTMPMRYDQMTFTNILFSHYAISYVIIKSSMIRGFDVEITRMRFII